MASTYLTFLQSPSTASLADDASIHYITTTTTITEPEAILKHLAAQAKQLVKKEENVIYSIEGDNGLCLETVTTLQFVMGGGAYLPTMDSNMLDERIVTFPVTHVVTFNSAGQIHQIRLYWDQGTLLKQVEAIGKTGRNWPIRDGKAQGQSLSSSVKHGGKASGVSSGQTPQASRKANDVVIREHPQRDSVSVTRDPHASLALFAERDPNEVSNRSYTGPKHSIRASAKPAPRDLGELFVGDESPATQPTSGIRSLSPHKKDGIVLKAGAGKHYNEVRLFSDGDDEGPRSPEGKKTFNQKYQHFTFGDGEDVPNENRPTSGRSKHQQTFSFEDFATPPKIQEKHRPDHDRHWGADVDADDPGSPPKRPVVHASRPDAEAHFSLDDSSPGPAPSGQRQKGAGLSQDTLYTEERSEAKKTNPVVNNARRGDDFGAHYGFDDSSPANASKAKPKGAPRSDLDTHWSFETPAKEKKIYKTAGDGMGSRAGARSWGIGDDSDPENESRKSSNARGRRAQAQAGADLEF